MLCCVSIVWNGNVNGFVVNIVMCFVLKCLMSVCCVMSSCGKFDGVLSGFMCLMCEFGIIEFYCVSVLVVVSGCLVCSECSIDGLSLCCCGLLCNDVCVSYVLGNGVLVWCVINNGNVCDVLSRLSLCG